MDHSARLGIRWLAATLFSSVGKKGLMALSGAGLGFFLLSHLLGNAMIFAGRRAYLDYAALLRHLGPLLTILEAGLLLTFLVHISLAVSLYIEDCRARPQRYVAYQRTAGHWGARTMPYTGLLLLLFLGVHLAHFHFSNSEAPIADQVRSVLQQPAAAAFYILTAAALALHVSHGFWSMFQSLGLNRPLYEPLVKTGALAASLATGAVFILIPLLALLSAGFLLE